MLIDCDTCTARPRACGDCIVTHLLSVGPVRDRDAGSSLPPEPDDVGPTAEDGWVEPAELDEREIAAVGVLAAGGLVPPLRLVPGPGPTPATSRLATPRPSTPRPARDAPPRRPSVHGSRTG